MKRNISTVTVFDKPHDFPDSFVARRFYGAFATSDYVLSPTLDGARDWARTTIEKWNQSQGVALVASEFDHPSVVETWI